MNTFRKIRKNAKALSPVVASIILIAVTVAVSVVVAAWMGGMSIGLMGNAEKIQVTNVAFTAANQVTVSFSNSGGADVQIAKYYVNGVSNTTAQGPLNPTVIPKDGITDAVLTLAADWTPSTSYEFKFTTAKGNSIAYTEVSPAA